MQDLKNNIEKILNNKNINERELIFQLKKLLYENESLRLAAKDSKTISELVNENIKKINCPDENIFSVNTNYASFDNMFGGLAFGEYVVIGGRPSMGKTQLLVNLALNLCSEVPVLYFSFDLSEFLLTNRFLSSMSEITITQILQHKLSEKEKKMLTKAAEKLQNKKLFINDSCSNSITAFKNYCLKHIEENGIKIIMVDYIQMMTSGKFRNYRERELEISYISREIKNIAKEHNICFIVTSQLNRSVETRSGGRRPILSDLRESGAIEQDADKVIFIHRPEYYGMNQDDDGNSLEGIIEIIMSKNKNGRLGSTNLMRNNNFTNISDFDINKNEFEFSDKRIDEIEKPF